MFHGVGLAFPLFHETLSEEANYLPSTRGVPGPRHSAWHKYYLIKSQFNEILIVVFLPSI